MLTVVVHEIPSTQGSKKSFTDNSGHVRTVEDNRSALMVWRGAVAEALVKAREGYEPEPGGVNPYRNPLRGPVALALTFTLRKPVSTPKRKPAWPLSKRDADKLERAVFDALTIGGAYEDDGQVVDVLRLAKQYPLRDVPPVYTGHDAAYMLTMGGTSLDVLDHPGAVIRIAHYTELPAVRAYLAGLGFRPEDIAGGAPCPE